MTEFEQDVIERLTRIETKQDNEASIGRDHEERLRSIETSNRRLTGALGVFAAALGFLGYHITLH